MTALDFFGQADAVQNVNLVGLFLNQANKNDAADAEAICEAVGRPNRHYVKRFENGRQLAAWLGWVPEQHSRGGKQWLLGIGKHGDPSSVEQIYRATGLQQFSF